MKLTPANISFNESGTPTSSQFDDVYFSNANGLKESEYVFFEHNQLNLKWLSCDSRSFTVMETGFGTGLNFLLTWQRFRQFLAENAGKSCLKRLYFISTEKFPIAQQQLQQALAQWPEFSTFSEQLLVQYPIATPGCHRLVFDEGSVVLDLWLGDLNDTLPALHSYTEGSVDAWYLDGFAPGKNPDMWQDNLFRQMARLSKAKATFATFTAAGIVKRGLKSHGFVVNKVKGFGTKRDMLAGYFAPQEAMPAAEQPDIDDFKVQDFKAPDFKVPDFKVQDFKVHSGPWHREKATLHSDPAKIAIIGGGLAGANLAYALSRKGFKATVYFKGASPLSGASGNHQGGFYPNLTADFSIQSQFYCQAFSFAHRYYTQLAKHGADFGFDWCGVFFPGFSDVVSERQTNLLVNDVWPKELITYLTAEQATTLCGMDMPYDGLYIPSAGWINPSELVTALLEKAQSLGAELIPDSELITLNKRGSVWQCQWHSGELTDADIVILATGSDATDIPFINDIPFTFSRGQVEHLPANQGFNAPKTVICHKGYFTPAYQDKFAMGATFDKRSRNTDVREDDTRQNVANIKKALTKCRWLEELPAPISSRAAIRCSLPDHRPVMGAVPDLVIQKQQFRELYKALPLNHYPLPANQENMFVLTGLGSHGLCTSPLLAEALACQLSGEPLPLNQEILASLSPNRFLIRNLIRAQNQHD